MKNRMFMSQIRFRSNLMLAAALCVPLSALLAQPYKALPGHVNPLALPQYDQGPVEPNMRLSYVTLILKRSDGQQAALDQLLEQQQDMNSPEYHKWLTPEQFADRFGGRQEDIDRLTSWLKSNGFSIIGTARGRDYIAFSGTSSQVETALHTSIHRYKVNGEVHYANSGEPEVPEELTDLVAGFRGLDDFYFKPSKWNSRFRGVKVPGGPLKPEFYTASFPGVNILAPDDLAIIYNINALYSAGIDGSGMSLAVAGASDIDLSDVQVFRSAFGLSDMLPSKILVPGAQYPGIVSGADGEADLDVEWAGAIARNASILYVYSPDPVVSAAYAIDEVLAPVLTFSFSGCELRSTQTDVAALAAEAQKAAVEGITWLASSGDSGAAACEDQNGAFTSAITRLNVNLPASLPWVTSVGGTEFNEGSGNYWANTLGPNGGSALGYIPEGAWTDEAFIANNDLSGFAASGGGASRYFAKPSWQAGPGVPSDGARDVPDVALTASWFHDAYALITEGEFEPNGGTSASTPAFAGIVLLLNQYLMVTGSQSAPGLGNINPMLYSIAERTPGAFHDVISGSNIVPCVIDSTQDCTSGEMGYSAGPGYDQVTGLGSVDAYQLALAWPGAASRFAHLVVTRFIASTTARAGGPFNTSVTVTNEGNLDAGGFRTAVYFTSNGDRSTASPYFIYCDTQGLTAGATFTCEGTVNLGPSIVPGMYLLLAVADANNSVPQLDRTGGTALSSTGPLTVTK